MRFDQVVGQQNAIRNIKTSLARGRVAHAYLFSGPDGVGKSLVASCLAAALNCREKGVEPCGACPSCIRAESGNHPDIIHVKSQKASISIDDIREINIDARKKPYEKGFKIYIIHEAEKMTAQAQNALLKTLEEPPPRVVFILLSNSEYSLLNTIRSRCQVVKFSRAPLMDIENYLIKEYGLPQGEARFMSSLSEGIVGNALKLVKDEEVKREREEIIQLARDIRSKDKIHALSKADYFMENKDKIDYVLGIILSYFRDIVVYKECGDVKYLINLDKADLIVDESRGFTFDSLNNIIETIKETLFNIKSNVNYQLSIETMLLSIQEG